MKRISSYIIALAVALPITASAQPITEKFKRFLTTPNHYVCYRADGKINIDGKIDEPSWKYAVPVGDFVDISGEGFPTPRYATQAKMLWDDDYIYVAAELEEPHVWADITRHDEVVYYNNDFEIFIDPDGDTHNYFEIEVNAIGTIFDLAIEKPYRAPTPTFVQFQWNCPGMKVATKIQGTLNNPKDTDKGWTVEFAIPRKAIAQSFDNYLKAGNYLRVGFSRVEWQHDIVNGKYQRKKDDKGNYLPEDNWTWGPTGMIAMHMPERWGYVYLSDKTVGAPDANVRFVYPADYNIERLLWAMLYEQEDHFAKTGRYHASVWDFKLTDEEWALLPKGSKLTVEAMSHNYEISVTKPDGKQIYIDVDGYLRRR